jgi:hypothetical protein
MMKIAFGRRREKERKKERKNEAVTATYLSQYWFHCQFSVYVVCGCGIYREFVGWPNYCQLYK